MHLRPNNPALAEARTAFPLKVRQVHEMKRLLQPAGQNNKIGKGDNVVTKGKWRGMPCFTLTLEERATCPSDCKQWSNCFGNNMHFAYRVDHRDHNELTRKLAAEIKDLLRTYRAIVVRPHVLGDFFSVDYVAFWAEQLAMHPGLHVFGFTHWARDSEIGLLVQETNRPPDGRGWIRFSDQGGPMSANVEGEGITCPEQTGKTKSCMTCGLCWSTTKPINFLEH